QERDGAPGSNFRGNLAEGAQLVLWPAENFAGRLVFNRGAAEHAIATAGRSRQLLSIQRSVMLSQRSSGILIHPTSLPSSGGIGDLGPAAYEFVNWLAGARQTLWQILPLGPVGHGNSPYSCTSAFAGNVLMISLERLADRGLLDRERVLAVPDGDSPVDFDSVRTHKLPLLREAAQAFLHSASGAPRKQYERFCRQNHWWLEDYVLFSALRERFGDRPWNSWPPEIVRRHPETIAKLHKQLHGQLEEERFLQFAFFEQWRALRSHCADHGVRVVGDVAIF